MATMKFNIGDRVKVVNPAHNFKEHYRGKEFTIKCYNPNGKNAFNEPHYGMDGGTCYVWQESELELVTDEKIVITHDGKTTTATLYRDDGSKEVATAKCSPEDTFDFNIGAKLAMERLMKKIEPVDEWRVVDRPARVGDYIRLKTNGDFPWNKPGDILKVDGVFSKHGVWVYGKNHLRPTNHNPNEKWNYLRKEYEVVERVTAESKVPEPPKYYSGKVVCTYSTAPWWTAGKMYAIVDGLTVDDEGDVRFGCMPITHPSQLTDLGTVKFIPYVE